MTDKNSVQVTFDGDSNSEVVMARVDKNIADLLNEKPSGRWDADYWRPKYEKAIHDMGLKYSVSKLGDFLIRCNQGDVLRTKKGDQYVSAGIPMISVIDIKKSGIQYVNLKQIIESHYQRIASAQPKYGDILIVRSGSGSIGKSAIFLGKPEGDKIGVTGHLNTLGFQNINPFYVEVFLKSYFGQMQIERFENGVSGQTEFTQDSISEINITNLPVDVQNNIEIEYKKMTKFHDLAMEAKRIKNETAYKGYIEDAERRLSDLIIRTEEVIRGERDNV